jgi:hypothetical protein
MQHTRTWWGYRLRANLCDRLHRSTERPDRRQAQPAIRCRCGFGAADAITGASPVRHGILRRTVDWIGTTDQTWQAGLPEVREALSLGQIATRPQEDRQQLGVAVPIKLRDVPVGALRLIIPKRTWNPEMAAALDSIAGHIAQASENARLIAETEDRLTRERALAEATEKVRQRSEIEAILETAATELARYLNASHIAVRMNPQSDQVAATDRRVGIMLN